MILRINDRIRNRKVEHFEAFTLSMRYDSVASAFSLSAYFNPANNEHKEMFCIGHYHKCTIEHNGELLLTGYLLSEDLTSSSKAESIQVAGYSLPGVIEDCQLPYFNAGGSLQNNNLTLREIATKYLSKFGLNMIVDNSVAEAMNRPYSQTTLKDTQTIKAYLTELASQRNVIISHDANGNVLFTKAKTEQNPILAYGEGTPFTKMSLKFNGQGMHSHITVVKQADSDGGGNAGEHTLQNPYVPYVYRPKVVEQDSGDDVETEQAAKNILASELKNLRLMIETDRWEIGGGVIKPNNIITVINPDIYLYKKTRWFIEGVDFVGDSKKLTATLTCVLPEVYSGAKPHYIFEGINTH
jgi:prophage tail gpP-like protein